MLKRSVSDAVATGITFLLMAAAAVLIYQRGGGLAWLGLLLGAGLLAKIRIRPSSVDLFLVLAIAITWTFAWAGVFYYVISTWETGEVVELTIETPEGEHSARTWILEEPGALILYYDAPGEVAGALVSGADVSILRGDEPLSFSRYSALQVDDMPEEEVSRLFGLMSRKYGERNAATDVFYGFLGRSRDRVGIVIKIHES